MSQQWPVICAVLISVLPLSLGCGSASTSTNNGLSNAELDKMMDDAKGEAAKAPAPEIAATKLIESLTGEAAAAAPVKKSLAEQPQVVTGVVLDRSPEGGDSSYLTLDGGTQKDKTYKLKFHFPPREQAEISSVKVGDSVRVIGTSDGELKDDTMEFKDCIFYPKPRPTPPISGPPPLPKTK